jgi:hypothetical protein
VPAANSHSQTANHQPACGHYVVRRSVVVSTLLLVTILVSFLVANIAHSETLASKISEADAQNLSNELKIYICADQYSAPDWCKTYRANKFGTSIAKWKKAREEARQAKIAAAKKAAHEAQLAEAKRQARIAEKEALAALAAKNDPAALARLAEIKAAQEMEKSSKAWTAFLAETDVSNLTMAKIMALREFAATGNFPEANEILGYAYSKDGGPTPVNLTEAYRQYGQAYVKGLKRVKPNLDRLWPKIPREQQMALLSEFK